MMFYHINCYSLYTCIIYICIYIFLDLFGHSNPFFMIIVDQTPGPLRLVAWRRATQQSLRAWELFDKGVGRVWQENHVGLLGKWWYDGYGKIMKNIGQWWKTYGKFTNHHWMIGKIIYFLLDYPTMICNFNSSLLNMLHRNSLFTELKDCDFHC